MKAGPALVVALLLAASGCGTSTAHPSPEVQPDVAAPPTWGGCGVRSTSSIDYAAGSRGERSLAKALAPYREPGDHVVRRPAHRHRNAVWLLVDERNVIHAAVGAGNAGGGWLVDMVERCAD